MVAQCDGRMKFKVIIGSDVTLTCSVRAFPPITSFDWLDPKRKVLAEGSKVSLVRIPEIGRSDAGSYTARASNPEGDGENVCFIDVLCMYSERTCGRGKIHTVRPRLSEQLGAHRNVFGLWNIWDY